MSFTTTEGAFLLIVGFVLLMGVLFISAAILQMVSDDSDDLPVDSGLRKSDVGRANSVWGDKD